MAYLTSITYDDIDLRTYGLEVQKVADRAMAPIRTAPVMVAGRAIAIDAGDHRPVRKLSLSGHILGDTHADLMLKIAALRHIFATNTADVRGFHGRLARQHKIAFGDETDRHFYGRVTAFKTPDISQRWRDPAVKKVELEITLLLPFALGLETAQHHPLGGYTAFMQVLTNAGTLPSPLRVEIRGANEGADDWILSLGEFGFTTHFPSAFQFLDVGGAERSLAWMGPGTLEEWIDWRMARSGTGDWSVTGGGDSTIYKTTSEHYYEGHNTLRYGLEDTPGEYASAEVAGLTTETDYRVIVRDKIVAGNVELQIKDGAGVQVGKFDINTEDSADWRAHYAVAKLPTPQTTMSVRFDRDATSSTGPSGAVALLSVIESQLTNGGLEAWSGGNPDDWSISGSATVNEITSGHHFGGSCAEVVLDDVNDGLYQAFTVPASGWYLVSQVVKFVGTTATTLRMEVGGGGVSTSKVGLEMDSAEVDTGIFHYSSYWAYLVATDSIEVRVKAIATDGLGSFYLDDVAVIGPAQAKRSTFTMGRFGLAPQLHEDLEIVTSGWEQKKARTQRGGGTYCFWLKPPWKSTQPVPGGTPSLPASEAELHLMELFSTWQDQIDEKISLFSDRTPIDDANNTARQRYQVSLYNSNSSKLYGETTPSGSSHAGVAHGDGENDWLFVSMRWDGLTTSVVTLDIYSAATGTWTQIATTGTTGQFPRPTEDFYLSGGVIWSQVLSYHRRLTDDEVKMVAHQDRPIPNTNTRIVLAASLATLESVIIDAESRTGYYIDSSGATSPNWLDKVSLPAGWPMAAPVSFCALVNEGATLKRGPVRLIWTPRHP